MSGCSTHVASIKGISDAVIDSQTVTLIQSNLRCYAL